MLGAPFSRFAVVEFRSYSPVELVRVHRLDTRVDAPDVRVEPGNGLLLGGLLCAVAGRGIVSRSQLMTSSGMTRPPRMLAYLFESGLLGWWVLFEWGVNFESHGFGLVQLVHGDFGLLRVCERHD